MAWSECHRPEVRALPGIAVPKGHTPQPAAAVPFPQAEHKCYRTPVPGNAALPPDFVFYIDFAKLVYFQRERLDFEQAVFVRRKGSAEPGPQ